jgi:hypothetical protein
MFVCVPSVARFTGSELINVSNLGFRYAPPQALCLRPLRGLRQSYLKMLFLLEYDRSVGGLVSMSTFDDSERQKADESRLDLELDLNRRGIEREVVILQAATEKAIRRTHRRYFDDLAELVTVPTDCE